MLLLPDKFTVLGYVLVLGLFTVVRFTVNWQRKVLRLACKAALILFWVLLSVLAIRLGLVAELPAVSPLVLAGLAVGWTIFLVYYDFCVTRIFAGLGRWLSRFH